MFSEAAGPFTITVSAACKFPSCQIMFLKFFLILSDHTAMGIGITHKLTFK